MGPRIVSHLSELSRRVTCRTPLFGWVDESSGRTKRRTHTKRICKGSDACLPKRVGNYIIFPFVWNCNIWHWTRYGLAPHRPYDDDEDKMVRLADDQFTANL